MNIFYRNSSNSKCISEYTDTNIHVTAPETELEPIEVIVKYYGNIFKAVQELNTKGIKFEILDENYAIVTLMQNQLPLLYKFPEIEQIELQKELEYMQNINLNQTCVAQVQTDSFFSLEGTGVLVGIIDSGIDYTHYDFRETDGRSRVMYIWDQSDTRNLSPPYGFDYGTEYTNTQINNALASQYPFDIVPQTDFTGHGTSVAGVAAGNGLSSRGQYKGVASKASIIVVKIGRRGEKNSAATTEIMRGIKYISDRAQQIGMPVVINLSFGTSNGSHDGTSLFETYIDSMSQKWKSVIVVASGNEGASGHHFDGYIRHDETLSIDFATIGGLRSMYITLWKNFVDTFSFELVAPNGQVSATINASNPITRMNIAGASVTIYYRQPTHYSASQEVFFDFSLIPNQARYIPNGIWRLIIHGIQVVEGRFSIWLPTTEDSGADTAFLRPAVTTTLTIPSTSKNALTVGGYNSLTDSIADFSGRGYTRNDVYVKPDLVAPAVSIISTKEGGGYDSFTGTSMAAPFVAGAAALMMEWGIVRNNDPFLYGQRIKAFLQKGAERKSWITYPNPMWGYGTLCLRNSMNLLLLATSSLPSQQFDL